MWPFSVIPNLFLTTVRLTLEFPKIYAIITRYKCQRLIHQIIDLKLLGVFKRNTISFSVGMYAEIIIIL